MSKKYSNGRRRNLREIPWGPSGDADEVCIYDNGYIEADEFLQEVRAMRATDVPQDARDALTAADVKYLRFRPMSPSEARGLGYDYGVRETREERGYAVTAVRL